MSETPDPVGTTWRDVRFARPYVLTGGRTRSRGQELPLETLVVATLAGRNASPAAGSDQAHILKRCAEAISIAEVAAHLHVPLGVARVLVGDLHADGLVAVHQAPTTDGRVELSVLERVLHGLHSL